MFERFSPQARRVLSGAEEEARSFGHDHIGTEHLLLGILVAGDCVAAQALVNCGATLGGCRQKAEEAVGPSPPRSTSGTLYLTERGRRSLERADRLSIRQRSELVEPEHILLSVIQVEGRAGQVLRGLGIDPSRVRVAVEAGGEAPPLLSPASASSDGPGRDEGSGLEGPGPTCPGCGAEVDGALSHRALSSRGEGRDTRGWTVLYCGSCGAVLGAAAT